MKTARRPGTFRACVVASVLVCSVTILSAEVHQMIYAKDTPPQTPGLSELDRLSRVTQYGITWTFNAKVPVGRFVNGDCYVVGPVTIVAIEPRPLLGEEVPESEFDEREKRWRKDDGKFIRNGSMLNPPARQEVAYDSGIRNWFRPDLVAVSEEKVSASDYVLSQNVPNPFNARTTISYALPEAGSVQLVLYNASGQWVRTLVDSHQQAGSYAVVWDGKDEADRDMASEIYVVRLIVEGKVVQTRRMTLVR